MEELDEVERELDKMGLRPGKIEELLAVGETYPDLQRQFSVIALGSVAEVSGNRHAVYLGWDGSERNLDLCCRGDDWDELCRFLALAKSSGA